MENEQLVINDNKFNKNSENDMKNDLLNIAELMLKSRMFIGSGKLPNHKLIPKILTASQSQVITVAVRRFDFNNPKENILTFIPKNIFLMPNTSGAKNAEEAVKIAKIARSVSKTNLIKIEIMTDNKYLLPNNYETAKACEMLVKEGFRVFPYMNADLYAARDMKNAGASAIMPLGSPIGTNKGLQTKEMINILLEEMDIPIIVDAGIGRPSDACECMEMGCAAIMINTAISSSKNPILMASAFKEAVMAGRKAFLAKIGKISQKATASSPLTKFLQ